MEKKIVEEIRKFVENKAKNPKNWGGYEFYSLHLVEVRKYAKLLAEKLGVDVEIVELAVWLHDVGSIIYGIKDHYITGAKITEKKLSEFDYNKEKYNGIRLLLK